MLLQLPDTQMKQNKKLYLWHRISIFVTDNRNVRLKLKSINKLQQEHLI